MLRQRLASLWPDCRPWAAFPARGLLATVILGVANVWVRGDKLFNLVKVPAFDPGNKALRASVEDYHAFAANFVLILAGLQAAAGLAHHYLLKDTVLGRMLPGIGKR